VLKTCGELELTVQSAGKAKTKPTKKRVVVRKADFDRVLGKLIQTKPIKRK
jgi:hypothetical protein